MSNKAVSEKADRLEKLQNIIKKGINPYPASSNKSHDIKNVLDNFNVLKNEQKKIILAGRIRIKRSHGNLIFINLQDASAKIQVAASKKELDADSFKNLNKLIDAGDFMQAEGICFVTNKGENSLLLKDWKLLSKAIRPLPEKWHGIKSDEDRYRKRYLDLLTNDNLREIFLKKTKFWDVTRNFMKDKGFFEVETPTLETTTGGAEANPFKTFHNDFNLPVFLRISVGELWQKRLMAAGFEKTFEIGKVFRNEGSSPNHLQEFTNMEFYWAYADYRDGMELARELYITIAQKVFNSTKFKTREYEYDLSDDWIEIDYSKEVMRQTGIDVLTSNEKEIKNKLNELGVKYEGENRERLTDTLWKYCRKNITGPAFLINHPKLISPLAKEKADNPQLTERFQIIIAGAEIGNGYSELNDPIEQRKRFEEQQKLLNEGDDEAMMPDWEFVEMLEHGMPPTCGFGFGERLFSFFINSTVREASLFPLMKPREKHLLISNDKNESSSNDKINVSDLGLDHKKALDLVEKYIKDENTKKHLLETEAIMRSLAKHFGENEEAWGIIGLLHDIDWDDSKDDVEKHCVLAPNILKKEGGSDVLISAIISHAYENEKIPAYKTKKRSGKLQHSLAAAETITGLIVASALMQQDKKLASVKLKSLKKKYKVKSFAKNCDRKIIAEIEKTGISLDEFFEISLESLKKISDKLNL